MSRNIIFFSILLLIGSFSFPIGGAELDFSFFLGAKEEHFDFPPIISDEGRILVAFEVLRRLSPYNTYSEKFIQVGPAQMEAADSFGDSPEAGSEGNVVENVEAETQDANSISIKRIKASPAILQANLPESFRLGKEEWHLLFENGSFFLADKAGSPVAKLYLKAGKFLYIPESGLSMLGFRLAYFPEKHVFGLVGKILSSKWDASSSSLILSTLVPATASLTRLGDGQILLQLFGCSADFAPNISLPKDVARKLSIDSGTNNNVNIKFEQAQETGYKLHAEKEPFTYFRIEFQNHFELVSYERASTGEIALNVQFSRATPIKSSFITAPDRLVLDFPGAIYEEATKRIEVGIGSVKEIRIGQFQKEPPTVRVVVEMSKSLSWRILPKEGGRRYFVQFLRRGLKGSAVMLDAGHGGSDTGAIGVSGIYEKDITLIITRLVEQKLRSSGIVTLMTRSEDRFVSLGERGDLANSLLPTVFVSIHANSMEDPTFSGVMTFHYPGSEAGNLLARLIQKRLVEMTGSIDRGVRTANFFVLRETAVPAVLIEVGFMTNSFEESKLKDPSHQQNIADAITRGILDYLQVASGL